ncbi:asparaginase [Herbiconiux ginsengi]|uniref:Asparaginase n=1 Tax=Herbiconiux ginsengi TaxID=381665 RepID=A0A1H3QHG2_9MICO|nr:asparaginase [Herbiconiux ginsengi]SDZ12468.1 asparaginase [Herbiconiux ginsengi]
MSGTDVPGTATLAESVELAVVTRSGFVESRHAGSAVVLSPGGEIVASVGAPDRPVYPRSSLKPFQALTVLESGVELGSVQTAMSMASHTATPAHVAVVRSMLELGGLTPDALGCPADWPADAAARTEVIRSGGHPERLFMTCSGKHAAMLLACAANDWSTTDYLDLAHPLQQRILATVERLTGEPVVHTGVDGCGTPVHAMSLTALARGYHRLRLAEEGPARQLVDAALANGWAVEGPGRPNTIVIDRLGVLAKFGADGVMVLVAPDGTTVALKILDGNLRPATLVALSLLARHSALEPAAVADVVSELDLTVWGRGEPVGAVMVSPNL